MVDFAVKIFFDTLYAVLPPETIRNRYLTVIVGGCLAVTVLLLAVVLIRLYDRTMGAGMSKVTPKEDTSNPRVWVPYEPRGKRNKRD